VAVALVSLRLPPPYTIAYTCLAEQPAEPLRVRNGTKPVWRLNTPPWPTITVTTGTPDAVRHSFTMPHMRFHNYRITDCNMVLTLTATLSTLFNRTFFHAQNIPSGTYGKTSCGAAAPHTISTCYLPHYRLPCPLNSPGTSYATRLFALYGSGCHRGAKELAAAAPTSPVETYRLGQLAFSIRCRCSLVAPATRYYLLTREHATGTRFLVR